MFIVATDADDDEELPPFLVAAKLRFGLHVEDSSSITLLSRGPLLIRGFAGAREEKFLVQNTWNRRGADGYIFSGARTAPWTHFSLQVTSTKTFVSINGVAATQ